MNKKLVIGIAAITAATTLANAEEKKTVAEVLGVEIYGQANVSVDYLDDGSDGMFDLSDNASRLGFKGSTVVNEDIDLIWQMESAISLDDGDSTDGNKLCNRNSFVGFKSSKGQLIFGRHDTPYKTLGVKGDLFVNRIGDHRNIFGKEENFNLRNSNSILYTTPSANGLTATVAYTMDEDATVEQDVFSANVLYKNGALLAGVACEMHGEDLSGGDASKGIRAMASYKTGDLKTIVTFESLIDAGAADATCNSAGIGFAYDLAENLVLNAQCLATVGDDSEDEDGAVLFATGLDYKAAKNTTLYVAVAAVSNGDNASYSMSGGGGHETSVTPAAGYDSFGVSLGLIHKFSYK